ncbi:polyprenyl synthetase family protein [Paracoccaceae bacterium]|nr:polyprenyl synthetase family protein [Paracoccaceae bacterium]
MFPARLTAVGHGVQQLLDQVLQGQPHQLAQAMMYAVQGGKRLRAFLVLETARLHGIKEPQALWPATAIEAMHSYSLVHDDLPCMDDDDLRRGQPTVHMRWDQATAVLVGDALQALAFELVAHPSCSDDPAIRAELAYHLAVAAGGRGMVLGQAEDIAAETADVPLDLAAITGLQGRKTGALFHWSATVGPRMAKADIAPLGRYADALGLAFQIADDILDVEGDSGKAGKRLQKDGAAGKATFVSLLGLDAAKRRAGDLVAEAQAALEVYGDEGDTLRQAAQFVIARDT